MEIQAKDPLDIAPGFLLAPPSTWPHFLSLLLDEEPDIPLKELMGYPRLRVERGDVLITAEGRLVFGLVQMMKCFLWIDGIAYSDVISCFSCPCFFEFFIEGFLFPPNLSGERRRLFGRKKPRRIDRFAGGKKDAATGGILPFLWYNIEVCHCQGVLNVFYFICFVCFLNGLGPCFHTS